MDGEKQQEEEEEDGTPVGRRIRTLNAQPIRSKAESEKLAVSIARGKRGAGLCGRCPLNIVRRQLY